MDLAVLEKPVPQNQRHSCRAATEDKLIVLASRKLRFPSFRQLQAQSPNKM